MQSPPSSRATTTSSNDAFVRSLRILNASQVHLVGVKGKGSKSRVILSNSEETDGTDHKSLAKKAEIKKPLKEVLTKESSATKKTSLPLAGDTRGSGGDRCAQVASKAGSRKRGDSCEGNLKMRGTVVVKKTATIEHGVANAAGGSSAIAQKKTPTSSKHLRFFYYLVI